jgi:hypothetical protein
MSRLPLSRFLSRAVTAAVLALVVPPLGATARQATSSAPPAAPAATPLFASHEPLQIRFEAAFAELRRDTGDDPEERESMMYVLGDEEVAIPVRLRTRGNFRLRSGACQFPPLRLHFRNRQTRGTIMEGQDRLKLVTFCRDRDNYEQNTLKEYLAYRIHNLLTDESFQVRLASITYLDVAGRDSPVERWGFVIEANEELAARLGGEVWEPEEDVVNPGRIPTPSAISVALFQYFIGNTDFSIYARHNMVLVDSSDRGVVAVPYDFDWSGLVSAPYATPDASLGTRTVRDRLYRELCRPGVDFQAYFAHYQSKRAEIEALIRDQVGLSENTVRDMLRYIGEFYDTIGDERRARDRIVNACRPV